MNLLFLFFNDTSSDVKQCKSKGLKVAVASSADLIKVKANLSAANLPLSL